MEASRNLPSAYILAIILVIISASVPVGFHLNSWIPFFNGGHRDNSAFHSLLAHSWSKHCQVNQRQNNTHHKVDNVSGKVKVYYLCSPYYAYCYEIIFRKVEFAKCMSMFNTIFDVLIHLMWWKDASTCNQRGAFYFDSPDQGFLVSVC